MLIVTYESGDRVLGDNHTYPPLGLVFGRVMSTKFVDCDPYNTSLVDSSLVVNGSCTSTNATVLNDGHESAWSPITSSLGNEYRRMIGNVGLSKAGVLKYQNHSVPGVRDFMVYDNRRSPYLSVVLETGVIRAICTDNVVNSVSGFEIVQPPHHSIFGFMTIWLCCSVSREGELAYSDDLGQSWTSLPISVYGTVQELGPDSRNGFGNSVIVLFEHEGTMQLRSIDIEYTADRGEVGVVSGVIATGVWSVSSLHKIRCRTNPQVKSAR